VWVGNADGAPTHELTGAAGAGPLFADVMRRAMADVPRRAPLYDPALLEEAEVCPLSGKRPGDVCPDRAQRKFAKGHAPREACAVHVRVTAAAGRGGRAPWRCDPQGDRTIALLPEVLADWLRGEAPGAPGRDPFGIPWYAAGSVPGCTMTTEEPPLIQITSPAPGSVLVVSNRPARARQALEVRASVRGAQPTAVDFFLDGKAVARSAWPYTAWISPGPGEHEIVALPANPDDPAQVRPARFSVW
jgi:penicillin-binding protein 1C